VLARSGAGSNIRLETGPPPTRLPSELLARTLFTGVDATDVEVVEGGYGMPPPGASELVLGHECLAEVVEAPPASGLAAGDRIVPLVRHGCDRCLECLRGVPDMCTTNGYREHGIKELDGFMRDFWTDIPQAVVRAPADLGHFAVLTEPLSIVVKGFEEMSRFEERVPGFNPSDGFSGRRALVAGTGSLGSLAAFLLRLHGCEVTALDRSGEGTRSAKLLRSIGVEHVNTRSEDIGEIAKQRDGFDIIFEATGAPTLTFELAETLAKNGMLCLLGVPSKAATVELAAGELMKRMVLGNQIIFGSVNSNRLHFEHALEYLAAFLSEWPQAFPSVITHVFKVGEIEEALVGRYPDAIKRVVQWD
jgi:threonine dehydrogenase-like Zn-dependent dehydrogenase